MAIRKVRANINKKDGSIRGIYVTLPRDDFVVGEEVEVVKAVSAFPTIEKKPEPEEESLPDVDDLE